LGVGPQTVIVDDGTYRLWYVAGTNFGTIGYAVSDDGLSWTKHPEPVLERGRGNPLWGYSTASVVFDGSRYHMIYSGPMTAFDYFSGYAFSADGVHWTRYGRGLLPSVG